MNEKVPTKIRIRGSVKSFGAKVVLNGIDLDVGESESVVVIGGSGSGKSVLLKCILGLLRPEAGSILVDGEEVVGLRGSRRRRSATSSACCFRGGALFDSLPVWENVGFERWRGTLPTAGAPRISLSPSWRRSGSAQRSANCSRRSYRVACRSGWRSPARSPATLEIMFFDEPTTGLDPIMADVINNLIIKTTRQMGATALSITHDMASARKIAHRIAMLYQGRIIWAGPVGQIDRSGDERVEQFINGRAEGPIQMAVRA